MKGRPGTWILLSLVGLGTAALILMPGQIRSSPRFMNERVGFRCLKEYAAAQAALRNKGYGGNGQGAYWRDDIAGLYALKISESEPGRLIELSLACADTRPVTKMEDVGDFRMVKSAKAGYWFKALRFRDEAVPKPDRFAACGYPDSLWQRPESCGDLK